MKRLLFVALISVATAFVRAQTCTPVPPEVTSWWPFDETSGATAHDLAGTAKNDGTHHGSVISAAGMVGGAACYNGIDTSTVVPNNPEIDFPNHCEVDAGTSFTIDFWVKTDVSTGTDAILDKRESDGSTFLRGYHVFVTSGFLGFQAADGNGALYCSPSQASPCTNFRSPFFIADGAWHFVAVTIVQSCFNNEGTFYVDGLESTFLPHTRNLGNSADLYIGQRMPNLGGEHFRGCIDELEIGSAMSKSELDAIYAAGSAGKCKPQSAAACPLMNACIGECGQSITTQVLIPAAGKGLQLSVLDGSLCANEAVKLTLQSGSFSSTQTFTAGGPVTTFFAVPLAPPDVLHVIAVIVPSGSNVTCKREGNFAFALSQTF